MSGSAFLDNLKQLFAECDTDNNGSLGRQEFHQLCAKIGLNREAADETFQRLDADKDDRITFDEFAAGFNQYSKQLTTPSTSPNSTPEQRGASNLKQQNRSLSNTKISALARQKNAGQIGVMSLGSTGSSSSGSSAGASSSTSSGNRAGLDQQDCAGDSLTSPSTPIMINHYDANFNPRSIIYDSEHLMQQEHQSQSGFGSLMSDSSLNQVKTFQDLVECIQKLQNENQILSQTFFKDKRERDEYISQLGEEFDLQVREVEERANRRARQELEAEKKRLRDMMQAERETLQHHYQTIEKMSKLIKNNIADENVRDILNDESPNIVKVKSKLEDTYLENRKLKKSLLDTKSDVAMIRKEMEKLKRQYEVKLSSAHERNDETRNECDHIKQQLDLMKDSNRKLQDASDVITNYITDKIDPVIKGAYLPTDDDSTGNYFLSPNLGPASGSGQSQSNSRKGSILSEYLGANQDEDEFDQPYSLDGTLLVPNQKLESQIHRASTSGDLAASDNLPERFNSNRSENELNSLSKKHMSTGATLESRLSSDHKETNQDHRSDDRDSVAQDSCSSLGDRQSTCSPQGSRPESVSRSTSKSSSLRQFFLGSRTQSDAKLETSSCKGVKTKPKTSVRELRTSASADNIESVTIEPADGPCKSTFNIILVGDSFVGKSSFAARFMEGTFVQGLISNCSIDFKTKAFKIDGVNYTVNLWDTA